MPMFNSTRRVKHSSAEMFALVADVEKYPQFLPLCEEMGLMVRPIGHLNVMSPPLVITRAEVDFIAEVLEKAIRKVTDDLVREGLRIGG